MLMRKQGRALPVGMTGQARHPALLPDALELARYRSWQSAADECSTAKPCQRQTLKTERAGI